ncbi:hypothetical protein, partial [Pseudomonas lini]|uniref:hypothetical protein n=1 Tax=Pseudomonas lini TaxID=163011 RepID=UPI0027D92DDD
ELKRNRCRKLRNSLFTKEFSVSTAPEVGRIIDTQDLPSSVNSAFLSITCPSPESRPDQPRHGKENGSSI